MPFGVTRSIGMLLLALYLILTGLFAFIPVGGPAATILAVLALLAGIFILVGR